MKFRTLLIVMLVVGYTSNAQETYTKWALEAGLGVFNASDTHTSGYSQSDIGFPEFSLGGRYMFNETIGLRATGGYLRMSSGSESPNEFKTNYYRASIEGIVNLGQFFGMGNPHTRFNVMAHAGGGVSKVQSEIFLHYTLGIMPQFELSDKVSLFGDISYFGHKYQSATWDGALNDGNGNIWSVTVGVVYSLGTDRIPWSRRIQRR